VTQQEAAIELIRGLRARITDLQADVERMNLDAKRRTALLHQIEADVEALRAELADARAQIETLTRERDEARAWGVEMRDVARDLQEDLEARLPTRNTRSRKESP
jgi:chromosome segregation ATPase